MMELLESNQFRVAIEGNIACGKSTLLRHLSKGPHTEVHFEPVDKWRDIDGENLLARYYQDSPRYAYLFQKYVMLTMLDVHHTPQTKPLFLMERSVFSSRYCFVKTLHDSKALEQLEFNCFDHWFQWLIQQKPPSLDLIIYMKASPETCLKRLYERSRKEEKSVPLSFLQALHGCYESWLGTPGNWAWHRNTPVLILDGDVDLTSDAAIHNKMSTQIWQALEKLKAPKSVHA